MSDTEAVIRARKFLAGERLRFAQADALWNDLKKQDQFSLARRVLEWVRQKPDSLSDGIPDDRHDRLCREEALLTSKDPELNAATRHDDALRLLSRGFRLKSPTLDGDGETLGIAGARVAAANAILDCAYGKPVVVEKNHYHQCPHMAFAGLYSPKCHCVEMRAPAAPEKNPWAASAPKRSLVSCILEDSRWRQ